MPARIATLHDIDNTIMYPETIISAVHMPDGKRTLQAELEQIEDESRTIEFNADGTITTTYTNSGMYIVTSFTNGEVVEVCYNSDASEYYTMTTSFNADGSITVSKVYAE